MRNVVFMVCIVLCVLPFKGKSQQCDVRQDYMELSDGRVADPESWNRLAEPFFVSWGTTGLRYPKYELLKQERQLLWKGIAWRGERINAQAFIGTMKEVQNLTVSVTDLRTADNDIIAAGNIQVGFVRYVMTDELNKDKQGTCGHRPDRTQYDSSLVADVIDTNILRQLEARSIRPVWMTVRVPLETKPGVYRGKLSFGQPGIADLSVELRVISRQLPAPEDWTFRLDLWQNPFAVARFHDLSLWSDEHLEAMRPVMQLLADAGQKIITATIMHKPWGGQTEDYFESMVMRIKCLDGSWRFDYAVFDKWVEFMMDLGIDRQINCYTMIPWDLSFTYFDQASNSIKVIKSDVGSAEYKAYWLPFLADFARHLKDKGWFEKTMIAMDERPMNVMQKAIGIIREADPAYKVALAGNYHPELEADIDDYCVASGQFFPTEVLKERRKSGKISTYYTCCVESYPNTYTFSPPAESAWLGWYAAAHDFDGYLRWAYNSWTENPLTDSRFRAFGGGDCYLVYPGGRSSIRMERLIEGIQDFEKIKILKEEYDRTKNKKGMKRLEQVLENFQIENLPGHPADGVVKQARKILNE